MQAKFFSGDCIVTEELVTAAGGPQFTNGVLMTFGQDPRTLPDGKAVIEKFRASGFEPEGYTLYAYASIQAIAAAWNAVGTDNAKASDWLEEPRRRDGDGQESLGWQKATSRVSDYVVYQWDDKGKYHQL
ncbi:hydrophobic amino acid ABC transporter periplasmic amino acid-binding protein [Klebsiella pneumoniae]|uniref:Hydrophobic amino acid ABC transporter periplasmic amino acid-binding protein n=1 Tax=Klebsiella pneumoniae TaxID=573 RepID=A0A447S6V5_KLEPN|nr:hydrophobic amino acid ABC transporter periplasmic amino acid-binding protein [Klebsiella pneumoniae]